MYTKPIILKNYSREEVMNIKNLELFLILLPVDYLKEILIPENNKLPKHPMEFGELIRWPGVTVDSNALASEISRILRGEVLIIL